MVLDSTKNDLTGKVAIVTGAGQGMGSSIAHSLAERGAAIVVNDINENTADSTAADIRTYNTKVISYVANVIENLEVEEMVQSAASKFGKVDILVNNAGVLRPTPLLDISEEEWDYVVEGNLKSTFLCSKAVLPLMQANGWGRVINISSSAGKNVSTIGGAHYTAGKAAVLGLTRHMAKEVAEYGITVNAVCPGLIETEMVRSTISEERTKQYADMFPAKRLGLPQEVADLVTFLASDQASYITGASIDINGGDLMI